LFFGNSRASCIEPVTFAAALTVLAAGWTFTSYASVKPILDAEHDRLPSGDNERLVFLSDLLPQ
jgi:hypothetical protein